MPQTSCIYGRGRGDAPRPRYFSFFFAAGYFAKNAFTAFVNASFSSIQGIMPEFGRTTCWLTGKLSATRLPSVGPNHMLFAPEITRTGSGGRFSRVMS